MRNYKLKLLVCITFLSSMSTIDCMHREDLYGNVQVYRENSAIIAISRLANSEWQTRVTKNANGTFTTESTMFNNTKNLRVTPVMPHPPLITFLKSKIAEFELAQKKGALRHSEMRSPTPEPEAIEVK